LNLAAIIVLAVVPATTTPAPNPDVDVCMRAAAIVAHSTVSESDRGGCACAVQQLHKFLAPGDYTLHEEMETIIASGADEKSFDKQMSDIMLKRGMNQTSANAFLARSHSAESKAQDICNPSPLLAPEPQPPAQ
jgi:hypothetical protein